MGTEKIHRNEYVEGSLEVQNGITASSDVAVTGTLTQSGANKIAVQSVSNSTGTTINPYGMVNISSTETGMSLYVLGSIAAGNSVTIMSGAITGTSGSIKVICAGSSQAFTSSTGGLMLGYNFGASGEAVTLHAPTTKIWYTTSLVGATGSATRTT